MIISASFSQPKPQYAIQLESVYGSPSQAGFGSAVFYIPADPISELDAVALECYRYFVGDLWDRFGETAWMQPWKVVYQRLAGTQPAIVSELQAIADPTIQQLLPLLLEVGEAKIAGNALADAYDDATVAHLAVYTLGDSGAMSGLLVAGQRHTGEITILSFLLD